MPPRKHVHMANRAQNAHGCCAGALFRRGSKQLVLATFQSVTKKRLKNLLNVAGTKFWNVAGTLILAILRVGGGHPDQPVGAARCSGDPSLARKRSTAHLFGYVASAVALAARRRARVPHGHHGLRGSPRQRSRDAHRGVRRHWRPVPSAAALPTSGRSPPPPPPRPRVHRRESPWWSCDRGAGGKNRSQGSATPRCPVRGRPHWRSTVR